MDETGMKHIVGDREGTDEEKEENRHPPHLRPLPYFSAAVTINVRRMSVLGKVNAPLPPWAKKILKIRLRNGASQRLCHSLHTERKCANTISTVIVPWVVTEYDDDDISSIAKTTVTFIHPFTRTPIQKTALFCTFSLFNFPSIFQGVQLTRYAPMSTT